jgi:hypothetical protein
MSQMTANSCQSIHSRMTPSSHALSDPEKTNPGQRVTPADGIPRTAPRNGNRIGTEGEVGLRRGGDGIRSSQLTWRPAGRREAGGSGPRRKELGFIGGSPWPWGWGSSWTGGEWSCGKGQGRWYGSAGRKEAAVSEHNLGLSGLWREFWRFAARFVVFFFFLSVFRKRIFAS